MIQFVCNRGSRTRGAVLVIAAAMAVPAILSIPALVYARTAAGPISRAASSSSSPVVAHRFHTSSVSSIAISRSSASLGPLETIIQTLNNCGPSSVASVLAYWKVYRTEAQVAAVLRADNSYWGMSPVDLPYYAQTVGLRALVGYGGSEKLVKLLLANGFPVIASQYVSASDPIRHYRVIEAYSDRTGTFVSADPYLGAGHVISYSEFEAIWGESDYRFQIIYPRALQSRLAAVLRAAGWNKTRASSGALRWEQTQMQSTDFANPGSWIWYNGYIDLAFDRAQLGQFRKAQTALTNAVRQGISGVVVSWVQAEIRMLQHGG